MRDVPITPTPSRSEFARMVDEITAARGQRREQATWDAARLSWRLFRGLGIRSSVYVPEVGLVRAEGPNDDGVTWTVWITQTYDDGEGP